MGDGGVVLGAGREQAKVFLSMAGLLQGLITFWDFE